MPYCTQSDLLEQISETELIGLSDDAGAGAIDATVIARSIADADAEIDTYCASRYTVPFATVPAMIRKVSVDVAIYNLFARRRGAPDDRKERYKNALRFLEAVAKGDVTLGADDPEAASQNHAPQMSSGTRIFTRDKMSGF